MVLDATVRGYLEQSTDVAIKEVPIRVKFLFDVGSGGKFRITVAREGMVWDSKNNNIAMTSQEQKQSESVVEQSSGQNIPPQAIEIESLQHYIFRIEKVPGDDKLKLMIEDAVNRYDLEFDRPRRVENTDDNSDEREIIVAQGVKGMLAKGPDLRMEIAPRSENEYVIDARASKGKKKNVFNDEILISKIDAERLKKYIQDNFRLHNPATVTAK
jgi:hypothetical protein